MPPRFYSTEEEFMKWFLFVTMLLVCSSVNAYVKTEWSQDPGGTAIATDATDHVYTAYSGTNPGSEINVTKRDSAGNLLWVASAPNIDVGYEIANWISVDHHGDVIVTGILQGGSFAHRVNRAGLVMKFDQAGNRLWIKRFEGIDNASYTRQHRVDAENNIYVIGVGNNGTAKVKKYSADGTVLWAYGRAGTLTYPYGLSITPENKVLVMTSASAISGKLVYAKLDQEGKQIWRKIISSRSSGYAADDSFGNTYLVHMDYGVVSEGTVIKKLSPTGGILWKRARKELATPFVAVGTDNNPVLSGYRIDNGTALVKYDTVGHVLWENHDADGSALKLLQWSPTQLDTDNNAYIQGFGALCKTYSDGTSAWATAAMSNDLGFSIGSDQSVYTVGATTAKLIEIPGPEPLVDLILDLTVEPNPATLGQTINFTAQVTNNSLFSATGVKATSVIASCSIGSLPAGATANCTLAEIATAVGTFSRTVTVTGNEADPVFSNNKQEKFITVIP